MKLSSKIFYISPVVLVLLVSMVQEQTSVSAQTNEADSSAPLTVIKATTEVSNEKPVKRSSIDNAHSFSDSDNAKVPKTNTAKDKQKPKLKTKISGPPVLRGSPDG